MLSCANRERPEVSSAPARGDLYAFRALWQHYRTCRRNKRNTLNALAFEVDAEANLLGLQRELRAHTYRPGQSICFVTEGHKPREVFAADFRDRVVHHLLVYHQERLFEPVFIHDSFACRAGKGVLAASDRLMAFLRRVTANGRRPAWTIHLDVASFFPSIHKDTLFELLCRRTKDAELRWLTAVLLFHDPTGDYHFRSLRGRGGPPGTGRYPVPPRKSLFGRNNERGLPIGNLTSQFWANVYLHELDQYAKHRLGCRYYVRYVDDVVMLSESRDELRRWRDAVGDFLARVLRLELREPCVEPVSTRRGATFVGWRTWCHHRVVGRQTLRNLRRRLTAFEQQAVRRAFGGTARRVEVIGRPRPVRRRVTAPACPDLPALVATLASYSGHLRHGSACTDWTEARRAYPWLRFLFHVDGWRVRARWRAAALVSHAPLRRNYRRLLPAAGDDVLLFLRVGRYVEFYGPQRLLAQRVLGLRPVSLARFGWGLTAGFPVWRVARFAERALGAGVAVVLPRAPRRPAPVLLLPAT